MSSTQEQAGGNGKAADESTGKFVRGMHFYDCLPTVLFRTPFTRIGAVRELLTLLGCALLTLTLINMVVRLNNQALLTLCNRPHLTLPFIAFASRTLVFFPCYSRAETVVKITLFCYNNESFKKTLLS